MFSNAWRALVFVVVVLSALVAGGEACTPAQREAAIAPAVRASCIVLRAIAQDGGVDEVCATAEDLAPFVVELLHSMSKARAEASPPSSPPVVAFAMASPSRRVPRRRCAQWVPVARVDASAVVEASTLLDGVVRDE